MDQPILEDQSYCYNNSDVLPTETRTETAMQNDFSEMKVFRRVIGELKEAERGRLDKI